MSRAFRTLSTVWVAILLSSCGDDETVVEPNAPTGFHVETIVGLWEIKCRDCGAEGPILVTAPPGDPRIFVLMNEGVILVIQPDQSISVFADLKDRILPPDFLGFGGMGSMVFDPDYASNGTFYLNYAHNSTRTRITRMRVSSDPNLADLGSEEELLSIERKPGAQHDVGYMEFDLSRRYLYISSGDGNGDVDPANPTRDLADLRGKILRIDVRNPDPVSGKLYSIPPDNPFVGVAGARPEVWAYGLRNPWRFSFDTLTGEMYLPDVGWETLEEINVAAPNQGGQNYGWPFMEGSNCTHLGGDCDPVDFAQTNRMTLPQHEYAHDIQQGSGCQAAIIGGYVYRGSAIPELDGHYFYADFCNAGYVSTLRYQAGSGVSDVRLWSEAELGLPAGFNVSSFGRGGFGDIYLIGWHGGRIVKLVPGEPARN